MWRSSRVRPAAAKARGTRQNNPLAGSDSPSLLQRTILRSACSISGRSRLGECIQSWNYFWKLVLRTWGWTRKLLPAGQRITQHGRFAYGCLKTAQELGKYVLVFGLFEKQGCPITVNVASSRFSVTMSTSSPLLGHQKRGKPTGLSNPSDIVQAPSPPQLHLPLSHRHRQ